MKKVFILFMIALLLAVAGCGSKGTYCGSPYILFEGTCCLDENEDGYCDTKETEETLPEEEVVAVPPEELADELFDCSFYSFAPYLNCNTAEKVGNVLYLTFETGKNKQGDYKIKEITFDQMPDCKWTGVKSMPYGGQTVIPITCTDIKESDFVINFEFTDYELNSQTGDFKTKGHLGSRLPTMTANIISLFEF